MCERTKSHATLDTTSETNVKKGRRLALRVKRDHIHVLNNTLELNRQTPSLILEAYAPERWLWSSHLMQAHPPLREGCRFPRGLRNCQRMPTSARLARPSRALQRSDGMTTRLFGSIVRVGKVARLCR